MIDVEQADATWYRRHLEQRAKRAAGRVDAVGRREQTAIQATAAKLLMTRRKVDQLRDATVQRDKSQAEIGAVIEAVTNSLRRPGWETRSSKRSRPG